MLLPRRLPTAISIDPILTAAMDTAISGREVETAKKKVPTNDFSNPVISAICSAKNGKASAATIITDENRI